MKSIFISCFMLVSFVSFSQNITISGKVRDESNKESLISASILVKGTTNGVSTDANGNFTLQVPDADELTLVISYVGYDAIEKKLTKPFGFVDVQLKTTSIQGKEVVISGSRVSETIMQSPVQIQKINAKDIRSAASGDFYQSLGNMKEVDIVQSSIGFKAFNTRGFNSTAPIRVVQMIDGMDNQAPGLSFPVGNLVGANDLDLNSVEVISGAASALYGPNAFQGVISMTTKNPWDSPGLAIQLKGGSRSYADIQARYARVFGEKKKFGLKVSGSYMRVNDWEANDTEANTYGDIETDQNITTILNDIKNNVNGDEDPETVENLTSFLTGYADFNNIAFPGIKTIKAPGYLESELVNYNDTRSIKFSGAAYYRFKPDLELSYNYRFGLGTAVYQGTNRYSINDIRFQQHKLELSGKNFVVRGYTTQEDAGNSYDVNFTGIGLSRAAVPEWIGEYVDVYFDTLRFLTNGYDADARLSDVQYADSVARLAAEGVWFQPGSTEFDSVYNLVVNDPNLQTGAKFLDQSWMAHFDGQYQFDFIKKVDILAGVSFRQYFPRSFGTIFRDTLVNPADTLENGQNDPNAEYVKITNREAGGFVQVSKKVFGERLRLIGSLRLDKNQNFDLQYSPRASVIYTNGNNVVRFSAQQAFRTPTLQNQFILLDLGPITLKGNTDGFDNLYTLNSVNDFTDLYDSTFVIDPSLLKPVTLAPLRPEQVRTLEGGYRGIFVDNKLFIDFNAYYNWYKNFIGEIRVVEPENGVAGTETGEDAILTETFNRYQIPINATETVRTWGASIALSYALGKGIMVYGNYTYADINEEDLADSDLIPGFNTSNSKFNVGLTGRRVWKGFGFNTNFKWNQSYFWQSSFGDGNVPSFYTIDANLSYEFKEYFTTLTVGGTNISNNRFRMVYGGPTIGGMVYASLLFDINKW